MSVTVLGPLPKGLSRSDGAQIAVARDPWETDDDDNNDGNGGGGQRGEAGKPIVFGPHLPGAPGQGKEGVSSTVTTLSVGTTLQHSVEVRPSGRSSSSLVLPETPCTPASVGAKELLDELLQDSSDDNEEVEMWINMISGVPPEPDRVGEIVMAKQDGWPHWPARIATSFEIIRQNQASAIEGEYDLPNAGYDQEEWIFVCYIGTGDYSWIWRTNCVPLATAPPSCRSGKIHGRVKMGTMFKKSMQIADNYLKGARHAYRTSTDWLLDHPDIFQTMRETESRQSVEKDISRSRTLHEAMQNARRSGAEFDIESELLKQAAAIAKDAEPWCALLKMVRYATTDEELRPWCDRAATSASKSQHMIIANLISMISKKVELSPGRKKAALLCLLRGRTDSTWYLWEVGDGKAYGARFDTDGIFLKPLPEPKRKRPAKIKAPAKTKRQKTKKKKKKKKTKTP